MGHSDLGTLPVSEPRLVCSSGRQMLILIMMMSMAKVGILGLPMPGPAQREEPWSWSGFGVVRVECRLT